MNTHKALALAAAVALSATAALADTVIFKNGDKLTGKVETLDGTKLKITSAVAGEVLVNLADVQTLTTDVPVAIQTADGKKFNEPLVAGDADTVKTAGGEVISLSGIKRLNPPAEKWSGSVVVNGVLTRGNTSTESLGVAATASLRRNNDTINDRFTLNGAYNFGRQRDADSGDKSTTTDNWLAGGQYDYFLDPKLYVYGNFKVEHDRIAELNYRLAPGVGVGYQWIETPKTKFSTEAGISYVYEDYTTGDTDEFIAARLAYHLTHDLNDQVSVFHNMEFLPAFEDPSEYNMTTDAGIRAKITKQFFSEFKVEWKRDTTPAEGAQKNDLRYVLGIGWLF